MAYLRNINLTTPMTLTALPLKFPKNIQIQRQKKPTKKNPTQLNRELRTQVSDTSKSAS